MSMEILSRHWEELKAKPNYLNSFIGTKFKDGKDTGIPAIVVYVSRKVAAEYLFAEHLIPLNIEGVPTDVVELAPTTWKAGKTAVSEKHPLEQKRLLGVSKPPKVIMSSIKIGNPATQAVEVDWLSFFSAIQNQANCGSCVAFGDIGVWEAIYRIAENNSNDPIKLSEACGFFCAGGSCENGLDVPTFLNYCQSQGVCPESFLPYKDVDQTCHEGILPGWGQYVKKIKSWQTTTDWNTIRQWITTGPLVAVMAVHQSFFSYQSGVYKSLGASDPVVGYHCIGRIGMSDSKQASHARNSWGPDWGEDGYFWIFYGDSEFDNQAWQITPDMTPGPTPPPAPPALAIITTSLPVAYLNTPYSYTLQATGGVPPYVWGILSLPQGLTLDTNAGIISGMPTLLETAPLTIVVIDSAGTNVSVQLTLIVEASPTPTPSPCKVGNGVAKAMNIITLQKLRKRKGRFMYMDPGKK